MRRTTHWAVGLSLVLLLAVSGRLAWLTVLVKQQAGVDEAQPADVILVLGAAAYRGKPSPVLKARLDHGLDLYRRHLARWILTTGGAGGDPDFTEGGVGRDYLIQHGVPAEAVLYESEGASTLQSVTAAAHIMQRHHLTSCIIVTDGYHVYRAKKMMEGFGATAYGSPRPNSTRDDLGYWRLCFRQAASYFLWTAGVSR